MTKKIKQLTWNVSSFIWRYTPLCTARESHHQRERWHCYRPGPNILPCQKSKQELNRWHPLAVQKTKENVWTTRGVEQRWTQPVAASSDLLMSVHGPQGIQSVPSAARVGQMQTIEPLTVSIRFLSDISNPLLLYAISSALKAAIVVPDTKPLLPGCILRLRKIVICLTWQFMPNLHDFTLARHSDRIESFRPSVHLLGISAWLGIAQDAAHKPESSHVC